MNIQDIALRETHYTNDGRYWCAYTYVGLPMHRSSSDFAKAELTWLKQLAHDAFASALPIQIGNSTWSPSGWDHIRFYPESGGVDIYVSWADEGGTVRHAGYVNIPWSSLDINHRTRFQQFHSDHYAQHATFERITPQQEGKPWNTTTTPQSSKASARSSPSRTHS